jgi:hypothetical protein
VAVALQLSADCDVKKPGTGVVAWRSCTLCLDLLEAESFLETMIVAQLIKQLTSLYVCVYCNVDNGPPKGRFVIQINQIHISTYVLRSSLILEGADKMDSSNKTDIFGKYPLLIWLEH